MANTNIETHLQPISDNLNLSRCEVGHNVKLQQTWKLFGIHQKESVANDFQKHFTSIFIISNIFHKHRVNLF